MAIPAEPQDVAYIPPGPNYGPSFIVLDDNFVNAKTGQEGAGKKAGFPAGTAGIGYNLYDKDNKLIGPIISVNYGNRSSGSANYHTITLGVAKGTAVPGFSGNPGYNAFKLGYAPAKAGGRRKLTRKKSRKFKYNGRRRSNLY